MRPLFLSLIVLPLPLQAETLSLLADPARATVYPVGATVVWQIEADLAQGANRLAVTGLPADTDPLTLRVSTPGGVTLGPVTLAADRLPDLPEDAALRHLRDEVARLEDALAAKEAGVAAIRARADAARAQVDFLKGLGNAGLPGADVEALAAATALVGERVLAAREAAIAAEEEARQADRALTPDREALAAAQQALEAKLAEPADGGLLTLDVTAATAGNTVIEVTTFVGDAGWLPVYDLFLTSEGKPSLTIERGVAVTQISGRDWAGVELTLSTAQPGRRAEPYGIWPDHRQIVSEEALKAAMAEEMNVGALASPVVEEAAVEYDRSWSPMVGYQGATVVYHFPGQVDLRSGSDALRLPLGQTVATPDLYAVAVPRMETTAYRYATFRNDGAEPLLPGRAALYLDGAFVADGTLPMIVPGSEVDLAYGVLDGITLERTMPDRMEGQEGLLTSSNHREEAVTITVENLTGEAWPLRLYDHVPYSEQKDLAISFTAEPAPTITDDEGKRGILRWDFNLAPGATQVIIVKTSLRWPDGYLLQ
ncbi:DUF4139 domain-containing protein [Frigidibacter sp. RF13]|uniref:DUF4139 domain-containing protein n=1 Tax=Frigidibacter sp. RF13 TaxID=2997340 RepID=UPI00226E8F25|nr:DUF4139 domain-containing protein [Frigidibacter sp. RF13]MCY1126552.1 DUF4139 domain-containing protein [Frigidibacter sp. RF13]